MNEFLFKNYRFKHSCNDDTGTVVPDIKQQISGISVQFSSVTIFMSRASLIILDYDGCAHA